MGYVEASWQEHGKEIRPVEGNIIAEELVSIHVNGREIASMLATPQNQDWLAAGFLKNSQLIEAVDEIELLHVTRSGCCVDVWLSHELPQPERMIISSGCGGGVLFANPESISGTVDEPFTVLPLNLYRLFDQLQKQSELYARAGGVHASGLSDGEELMMMVEDIGRHNTVDKLCGRALLRGIPTQGLLLITTGRVASEMVMKAGIMGCPVIASRSSPTSLSVQIAEAWNITLIGYVRRHSLRVYTHPERVQNPA